jgi:hypothetical protein
MMSGSPPEIINPMPSPISKATMPKNMAEKMPGGGRMSPRAYQIFIYIYFEDEPGRRSAAKLLSKDEAREAKRRPPFGGLLSWGLREGRPPEQ